MTQSTIDRPHSVRRAFLVRWGRSLRTLGQIFWVIAGSGLIGYAVRGFYIPNRLLSGGVSGIALLIHELIGWPVGAMVLAFNIPVFAIGFRYVGRRFVVLSGLGVLAFYVAVDWLPVEPLTQNPMLGAIFGGVLVGTGTSLALRSGGSSGGFDIIGIVAHRRFGIGVGEVMLALNGTLILLKGHLGSAELAMYTLIAIYASSHTLDLLQKARPRKALLIITRNPEPMRQRILNQMKRGLTLLDAEGGLDRQESRILLCVVTRHELKELQEIVNDADRHAFTVVLEASDVLGHFRRQSVLQYWRQRL